MANFYTSDHHFGHFNIIRYTNRPYENVQEMNEDLINKWNEVVSPKDTVYYIGDFSFLNTEDSKKILDRLNGTKILIKGNHDKNKEEMIKVGFSEVHDYLEIEINGEKVLLCHYPFVHSDLNSIARKRPNILNVRKKDKVLISEEKRELALSSFDEGIKFLKHHSTVPLCTSTPEFKEEFKFMKKLVSKLIGARPVNNGQYLIHGHTHNKNKFNVKAINVCTEAWGGYPVKEDSIIELMKEIKEFYWKETFKNINEDNCDEIKEKIKNITFTLREEMSPLSYNEKEPFLERLKVLQARSSLCHLYHCIKNKEKLYFSNSYDEDYLKLAKELKLYIAKEDLKKGQVYRGSCRNARLAIWNGEVFTHIRTKFGHRFPETIKCPEDDQVFDIFIAKEEFNEETAEEHEIEEIKELKFHLKL